MAAAISPDTRSPKLPLTPASLRQNFTNMGDDFTGMREAFLDLPQ